MATLKFAKINASTSGNNQLVPAVSGHQIRVMNYTLVGDDAVDVKFLSDGDSNTDLTGPMAIAAAGGGMSVDSQHGLFETARGEALMLNLSGAVEVNGHLAYEEIG